MVGQIPTLLSQPKTPISTIIHDGSCSLSGPSTFAALCAPIQRQEVALLLPENCLARGDIHSSCSGHPRRRPPCAGNGPLLEDVVRQCIALQRCLQTGLGL